MTKIMVIGMRGHESALQDLLAHHPDIDLATEVTEQKRDPFADVVEIHAPEPILIPPPLNKNAPYYEHYRKLANRRKR